MSKQDYLVGYKKPPQHTQFQKGQSGNPSGKVKGRKSYRTEFLEELGEKVTVSENGRSRKLSKQTLVIKLMVADAVNGNARAREQLLRLIGQIDTFEASSERTVPPAAEDAEIMARFKARLIEEIKAQSSNPARLDQTA